MHIMCGRFLCIFLIILECNSTISETIRERSRILQQYSKHIALKEIVGCFKKNYNTVKKIFPTIHNMKGVLVFFNLILFEVINMY